MGCEVVFAAGYLAARIRGSGASEFICQSGEQCVAEFDFTTGEDGQAFRARIIVLHRNRILQTLMLAVPDADSEFALRQENIVSPHFQRSGRQDVALVINDRRVSWSYVLPVTGNFQ
ncbi:MAG: hypothetical protein IPI20_13090 [Rhodoferax sp.]|nr:hypothetical protein [Rhodoferax sp.]